MMNRTSSVSPLFTPFRLDEDLDDDTEDDDEFEDDDEDGDDEEEDDEEVPETWQVGRTTPSVVMILA
ncbi:MAG: hypothetical protein ABJA98_28830 [Acidobacteriota bacterium]